MSDARRVVSLKWVELWVGAYTITALLFFSGENTDIHATLCNIHITEPWSMVLRT